MKQYEELARLHVQDALRQGLESQRAQRDLAERKAGREHEHLNVLRIAFAAIMLALLFVLALVTFSVQAAPPNDFYLEKVCPSLSNPYACDIQNASPFTQLDGGQINYFDRVLWTNPAGFVFEIAKIEITTGDDSGVTTGQVRWIRDHGLYTLRSGSGNLAGLHATGRVEFVGMTEDGRYLYALTGTYHVDP